jgi:hypothetical protein
MQSQVTISLPLSPQSLTHLMTITSFAIRFLSFNLYRETSPHEFYHSSVHVSRIYPHRRTPYPNFASTPRSAYIWHKSTLIYRTIRIAEDITLQELLLKEMIHLQSSPLPFARKFKLQFPTAIDNCLLKLDFVFKTQGNCK